MRARSQAARGQVVVEVNAGADHAQPEPSRCIVVERVRPVSRAAAAALGRANRYIAYRDLVSLAEAMGSNERLALVPMIEEEARLASWSLALGCPDVARNAVSRMVTLIEFVHSRTGDRRAARARPKRAPARSAGRR